MIARTLLVLRKDLQVGPRSPVFLWVLILPVIITVVLQGAFGNLFDPDPRLGIVDAGSSTITTAAREIEGVEVTLLTDVDDLKQQVEANDLDAGLRSSSTWGEKAWRRTASSWRLPPSIWSELWRARRLPWRSPS